MTIILASNSPRRAALLKSIGVMFQQISIEIDESCQQGELPEAYLDRMMFEKFSCAHATIQRDDVIIIVADTIVVYRDTIYGKPINEAEAYGMLRSLSNQTHHVMTAIRIGSIRKYLTKTVISKVCFREVSDAEIKSYWQTGEPSDKAGGYAIQGIGSIFIKSIEGSYSAIMGLPIYETSECLTQMGVSIL